MLFAEKFGMRKIVLVLMILVPVIASAQEQEPEYRYTLDEALITAPLKNGKKQQRAEMRRLLDRIYERLVSVDAPKEGEMFEIVSDIDIRQDSAVIIRDRLSGMLFELPRRGRNGKDSVALEVRSYLNYLDPTVKNGLENFDEDQLNKKKAKKPKESKVADETKQPRDRKEWKQDTVKLHKAMWHLVDARTVLKNTYQDEQLWNTRQRDDSTLLVTFKKTQGFIGIVTATQNIILTVDKHTYAIRSARSDIYLKLKLPFGYKLSPAQLEILNMVNLTGDDVEKFKIKTADVHVFGMENKRPCDGRMLPQVKKMKNTVSIADRKDTKIDFENTCTLSVK